MSRRFIIGATTPVSQGKYAYESAGGFRGVPINSQSGNYTTVAEDAGRAILHPSGGGAGDTFTIASNATVAYEVGTAITFINMDSNAVSIAIDSDTMNLAGAGTAGTRTMAQYGIATAIKVTSTGWLISGTNLTSGWSTTDKAANVAISGGGDSVATVVSTGSTQGNVRGAQGRDASDNRAFEIVITYTDGGGSVRGMSGLGTASAELAEYPGYDANGYGVWANSGNLYFNDPTGPGTALITGPIASGTDILTFHLNAGTLKVAKNGGTQVTMATGLTGNWFPMWGPGSTATGTRTARLIPRGLTHRPAGAADWD